MGHETQVRTDRFGVGIWIIWMKAGLSVIVFVVVVVVCVVWCLVILQAILVGY